MYPELVLYLPLKNAVGVSLTSVLNVLYDLIAFIQLLYHHPITAMRGVAITPLKREGK